MSGKTLRILLVFALVLVAFAAVLGSAYAQTSTPGTSGAATATMTTAGGANGTGTNNAGALGAATVTPRTLPTTGAADAGTSTLTVVLLALGATAGLGGLLLRGLRRPL
jgi:hypothetical protein